MSRVLISVALGWVAVSAVFAQTPVVQPADADIVAGAAIYEAQCASCHGADLEGQANWQVPDDDGVLPAPPHDETGHTWHHGDALLFEYTRIGGRRALAARGIDDFNSGMPPFEGVLTEAEIWDVLAYIKSTWPRRVQEMQAVRTGAEQLRGN